MKFEWDANKEQKNIEKHGINFRLAARVFEDKYRIEREDFSENNDLTENRIQTIGKVGKILFVVYTQRDEKYRIISARKADADERRLYNGYGGVRDEGWGRAECRG